MYRYILRESCSQFDSLPLTSLTMLVDQVEWLQHEVVARGGHVACMEGLQRRAVIDRALRLLGDVVRVRDDGACRDALISLSRSLRLCLSLSRLPPSPSPSPSFLSFSLSLSLSVSVSLAALCINTLAHAPPTFALTTHPSCATTHTTFTSK